MTNSIAVAYQVLSKTGSITTMKLQRLVFYCQALYLVRYKIPLFNDEIQSWSNGPVIPEPFNAHRGRYMVNSRQLGSARSILQLNAQEEDVVDTVVSKLGSLSGEQLREKTHREDPWKNAHKGYGEGEKCGEPITIDAMLNYYSAVGEEVLLEA